MGRPREEGVHYFPVDVDIFGNRKIKALRARFGSDGPQFYLYLLCEIYRGRGYYLQMDDYFQETAAAELGCTPEKIGLMLHFLTTGSLLLDSTLFVQDKVLTSREIQRRFQQMKMSAGRKTPISVNKRFWILDEEETETFIEVRQMESFSGKNEGYSRKNGGYSRKNATKERKRKESKGNERKGAAVEKSAPAAPEATPDWLGQLPFPLPPNAEKEIIAFLSQGATRALVEWAAVETMRKASGDRWPYMRTVLACKLKSGIRDVSQLKGRESKPTGSGFTASYDISEFEQQGFTLPEGWEEGG